jgi:hypothetical protein
VKEQFQQMEQALDRLMDSSFRHDEEDALRRFTEQQLNNWQGQMQEHLTQTNVHDLQVGFGRLCWKMTVPNHVTAQLSCKCAAFALQQLGRSMDDQESQESSSAK